MKVRIITIHQSLHRHMHVLGAERELVMTSALIALLVAIGGLTIISGVTAFIFWVVSIFGLRHMAKADPIMSKVWLRHIKQRTFYNAKSSTWRVLEGFKVK